MKVTSSVIVLLLKTNMNWTLRGWACHVQFWNSIVL